MEELCCLINGFVMKNVRRYVLQEFVISHFMYLLQFGTKVSHLDRASKTSSSFGSKYLECAVTTFWLVHRNDTKCVPLLQVLCISPVFGYTSLSILFWYPIFNLLPYSHLLKQFDLLVLSGLCRSTFSCWSLEQYLRWVFLDASEMYYWRPKG